MLFSHAAIGTIEFVTSHIPARESNINFYSGGYICIFVDLSASTCLQYSTTLARPSPCWRIPREYVPWRERSCNCHLVFNQKRSARSQLRVCLERSGFCTAGHMDTAARIAIVRHW